MKITRMKAWLLAMMLTLLCVCMETIVPAWAFSPSGRETLTATVTKKKKKKKNNYGNNSQNYNNQNNSGSSKETQGGPADAGEEEPDVSEDGEYTSKEEVAAYLNLFGHLPDNYITKDEARDLGWVSREGNLDEVAPGKSIGGDYFGNYEEILPVKKGRKYYECDIDFVSGVRGAERIIYSNDGYIYYTEDHYNTFEQLYPKSPDGVQIILGGD